MAEEDTNKNVTDLKISNGISIEDFQKVDIRAGKILSVEKVPDADKLLKLMVDFAELSPRQIISGIAEYFPDISVLAGKKCMFVANMEPRVIRGLESQGMLFAILDEKGNFSLLEPDDKISVGARAK